MKTVLIAALLCGSAFAQDLSQLAQSSPGTTAYRKVQGQYTQCLASFQRDSQGKAFVETNWSQERACERNYRVALIAWADEFPEEAALLVQQQNTDKREVVEGADKNQSHRTITAAIDRYRNAAE